LRRVTEVTPGEQSFEGDSCFAEILLGSFETIDDRDHL